MKKIFLLIFILILVFFLGACNSSSQEDIYGWWKPEKPTLMNNRCIYISKDIFKDNKEYKIIKWEKIDNSFSISFNNITALLNINDAGVLSITPQVIGGVYTFIRTTESEAKKIEDERKSKLKKLTTSHPDPF